ncbi:hypothetical protein [Nitrospirillum iridis]|uniref:Serine/threonine protein kinase n=1 Tax=Nitrospirillum iridis TaxID=765888 RepID=A0A7X0B6C4_9PROT|nr:hypothetical protein [Nitrospirillum iridis]MBB6255415.1 serine/threonine protein kinase [Nitrospirillum iridis]
MSSYSFVAADLKKIYGSTFQASNISAGKKVSFAIYDQSKARARMGMEAYGIFVDCQHPTHGTLPSFLKIFKSDIPERRGRTEFLIHTGLAKSHDWLFQGVPYAWLPGSIVNGHRIFGHVAHQIGARFGGVSEDFSRLKNQQCWDDRYHPSMRTMFAAHLCCAVAAMEKFGMVHGDLSGGNIMIGPGPNGEPVCTLCDFDGFHHPSVAPLPRRFDGQPCRPLGTAGYQYPELAEKVDRDPSATDPSIVVLTDRFALGVLICELMVWSPQVETILGRNEILSSQEIQSRSLSSLPDNVTKAWPAGFALIEHAMRAGSISDLPSPEDWLAALGISLWNQQEFKKQPYLEFYKRSGSRINLVKRANLSLTQNGNFGGVSADLANVQYKFVDSKLTFTVNWPVQIFVINDGRSQAKGTGPMDVQVNPNQFVAANGWEIRVFDGIP